MPRTATQFPAFETWQTMDESEQDALIDQIARARSRKAIAIRILIGLACTALGASLAIALYLAAA